MIIDEAANIAFLHIPKNAGSSLRDQMRGVSDTGNRFIGTKEHPELGTYYSDHIPLAWLEHYWPAEFEMVRKVESFALLRDPKARFLSALSQRVRKIWRQHPSDLSSQELNKALTEVLDHLDQGDRFPAYEFFHFIRQKEFTHLNGQQIITRPVRIEDFSHLATYLSHCLGTNLNVSLQANRTVTFRNGSLKAPLLAMKTLARRTLPMSLYTPLTQMGMALFTTSGATNLTQLGDSAELQNFICDYYAEDYGLLNQTLPWAGQFEDSFDITPLKVA